MYLLLLCLHPYHPDLTSISLEILNTILWESNHSVDLILESLNKIKNERNWECRLMPLIKTLDKSQNVLIIRNVLTFINSFIAADPNEQKRIELRAEFIGSGLKLILQNIKTNIKVLYKGIKG